MYPSEKIYTRRRAVAPLQPAAPAAATQPPEPRLKPVLAHDPFAPSGAAPAAESSGLIEPGNIDMTRRPAVRNQDGSVSSVRSISVGIDGQEVLIPTVVGNRIVSNDEAIAEYKRTGQHLGKFKDPVSATTFAQALHESEAAKLSQETQKLPSATDLPPTLLGTSLPPGDQQLPAGATPPAHEESVIPYESAGQATSARVREMGRSVARGVGSLVTGLGGMLEWAEFEADPRRKDSPRASLLRSQWEQRRGLPPGSYQTINQNLLGGQSVRAAGEGVTQKYPVSSKLSESITENPGLLVDPDWWIAHGPESAVTSAPFFATGVGGYALLGKAGAVALPIVSESLLEGSFVFAQMKQQGKSDQEASQAAAMTAAINIPLTALPAEEIFGGTGRTAIRRNLGSILAESWQETGQEITSNILSGQPPLAGVAEAQVLGAAVGGGMGAGGKVLDAARPGQDMPPAGPSADEALTVEAVNRAVRGMGSKVYRRRAVVAAAAPAGQAQSAPAPAADRGTVAPAAAPAAESQIQPQAGAPQAAAAPAPAPAPTAPAAHPIDIQDLSEPEIYRIVQDNPGIERREGKLWAHDAETAANLTAEIEAAKAEAPALQAKIDEIALARAAEATESSDLEQPPETPQPDAGAEIYDVELHDSMLPHAAEIVRGIPGAAVEGGIIRIATPEARDQVTDRMLDIAERMTAAAPAEAPKEATPADRPDLVEAVRRAKEAFNRQETKINKKGSAMVPPPIRAEQRKHLEKLGRILSEAEQRLEAHRGGAAAPPRKERLFIYRLSDGSIGLKDANDKHLSGFRDVDAAEKWATDNGYAVSKPAAEPAKGKIVPYRREDGTIGYRGEPIEAATPEQPKAGILSADEQAKADALAKDIIEDERTGILKVEEQAEVDRLAAEVKAFFRDQAKGIKPGTGLPIEVLGKVGRIGTIYVRAGTREFGAWSAKMVEAVGEEIRPFLDTIWNRVRTKNPDLAASMKNEPAEAAGGILPERQAADEQPTPETPGPADQGPLEEAPAADVRPARGKRAPRKRGPRSAGADSGRPERGDLAKGDEPGPGQGSDLPGVGVSSEREGQPEPTVRPSDTEAPAEAGPSDYRITDADQVGVGSIKAKAVANVEAIKLLKAIEAEGRDATPEEQAVLVKYTGWGAIPQAFDYYPAHEWKPLVDQLKGLLTDEELDAARASTPNAHYTSPLVVRAIWSALTRMGMKPGARVLEPGMGTGNFFGLMPPALAKGAKRTGVEMDSITGRIAKLLYPTATIEVAPFQEVHTPDNFYDVVVGNVPFGNYGVHDPKYKKAPAVRASIHDYFFARAVDAARPGGIVALITSRYTMDKANSAVRKWIADRADLVAAIRLPNTAFKGNAGTEVVTDIIFLRKRAPQTEAKGQPWVDTDTTRLDQRDVRINQYFKKHPDMMLGELALEGTMYSPGEPTIKGELTKDALDAAIAKLPMNVMAKAASMEAASATVDKHDIPKAGETKPGGYAVDGKGNVVVKGKYGEFAAADLTAADAARVKAMLKVRDAVREVFRTQVEDMSEERIVAAREALNTEYDTFVKRRGFLWVRENVRAFADDPDSHLLLSLEHWNPESQKATKADIFSKRTIEVYRPVTSVDTADEALIVSLNEKGRIDWERMEALTGRTADELQKELGPRVFQRPDGGQWETADAYLSGNVRDKLATAKAAATTDPVFARNVAALENVIPADLSPEEIDARLGAPWIPTSDVEEFVAELLEARPGEVAVRKSDEIAAWTIALPDHVASSTANREKYGVHDSTGALRLAGNELIDDALNMRLPTVRDVISRDPLKTKVNQAATTVARETQDAIKDEFRKWLWKDSARATRLARQYNDEYNNLRLREYDGSHLVLPGSNPGLPPLHPHQKNAIWRILQSGNTLLAHAVGAGKTRVMVGAAMEAKRIGLAKKSLFVVPNHMPNQISAEFLEMYPAANLLVAGEKDLSKGNRERFMSKIATGSYDAIVVTHDQFGKLPITDETFNKYMQEQLDMLENAILSARLEDGDAPRGGRRGRKQSSSRIVKELEKAKARLETKIQQRAKREDKDLSVRFEELGVDQMFVDEAHAFKNLWFPTKMTRVAGVPSAESDRSFDMLMKTQYLTTKHGGRGVVFATATPVSNTMAEVYVMQRYLQAAELRARGIHEFDAWAGAFGTTRMELESSPEDVTKLRVKTRFATFLNLPELGSLFRQVGDVRTSKMIKLKVPQIAGGKPETVVAPASRELKAFVAELSERAQDVRDAKVTPQQDNMLNITTEGRKAALDMRLINPSLPDDPKSKVNLGVKNIHEIWKAGEKDKTTQLVFIDLSTPKAKGGGFSVYDDMRAKLLKKGIPPNEIAFIHDAKTKADKQRLFTAVNEGRIRILFGSTEKMGQGTNVQRRLIALHHMDIRYRPSDVEQREGRILRQGNMNEEVRILRYVTEESFDAYMWGLLETKQRFIDQFLAGDSTVRTAEDISGGELNYAEVKAIATGNPAIMEKVKVDNDVRRFDLLRSHYLVAQGRLQRQVNELPGEIAKEKSRIANAEADIAQRDADIDKHPDFAITIGGKVYTGEGAREEAGKAIIKLAAPFKKNEGRENIGTLRGFPLEIVGFTFRDTPEVQVIGKHHYAGDVNDASPHGTVASLEYALNKTPNSWRDRAAERVGDMEKNLAQAKAGLGQPFEHEAKLKELLAKQKNLNSLLDIDKGDRQATDISDDSGVDVVRAERDDDDDTQGYSPSEPNYRRPEPGSEKALEIKGRYEILANLERKLNIPIRIGRMGGPKRRLGIFKVKPEVIRLRLAQDIAAASHDIGHALYKRVFKRGEFKPYRDTLIDLSQTQPKQNVQEGMAEFVNYYVTDPSRLDADPGLVAFFETTLEDRAPESLAALKLARSDYDRWLRAPASARMLAEISFDPKKERSFDFHDLYTAAVDDLHPIKVVEELMNGGKPLPPEQSSYVAHQVTRNWVGKAEMFLQKGVSKFGNPMDRVGEPLEDILNDIGWDKRKDFTAYITALTSKERIERGLLSPWDPDTVDDAINELKSPEFDALFERLRAYEDAVFQYVIDAGGLSAEVAEKARELNRDHVPLYRVMEVHGGRAYSIGRQSVDLVAPVKAQHGSARQVIDPIESIVFNTFGLIHWAERNYAANLLFDQAEATHGAGDLIERLPKAVRPDSVNVAEVLKKAGLDGVLDVDEKTTVTFFRPSLFETEPNTVTVWRGGEQVTYRVHPKLKAAMLGIEREILPSVLKFLRYPARVLRAAATSSIGFMQRNPVRDQFSAFTNTKYGFVPGVDWIRGVYHVLGKTDVYWDAKAAGALHGLMVSMDRDYISRAARHALKPHWSNVAREFVNPVSVLQTISSVGEEASRVMEAYHATKKKGRSRGAAQAAGYAAQELTIPFQRIGSATVAINGVAAFFNAGVQGLDKTARRFNDDVREIRAGRAPLFGMATRVFVGITVPSIIFYLLNKDEDWYKNKPRWERDLYWFPTEHTKIPKPFEPGLLFGSLVERMMEYWETKDPHAWDGALDSVIAGLPNPMPTGALPIVENIANYSFFYGRHIDPEIGQQPPAPFRYGPYTSQAAIKLGQIMGVSPNKIDNLIRGYTGGLGAAVVRAPERIMTLPGGEPSAQTWPEALFPGFVSRSPNFNAEPIERFYMGYVLSHEAAELHRRMKKAGEIQGGQAYLDAHTADLAAVKIYDKAGEVMAKIRKDVRSVMADGSMSGAAKRTALDDLADRLIHEATKANAKADALRSGSEAPRKDDEIEAINEAVRKLKK